MKSYMNTDARWETFLVHLEYEPNPVHHKLANAVRDLWWNLENAVGGHLQHPTAGSGGELGFQLSWHTKDFYLDIDVGEDGIFEWFCQDNHTKQSRGSEDEKLSNPPGELIRLFKALHLDC